MLLLMVAWEASGEYQEMPIVAKNKPLWLRLQMTDIYDDINAVTKADVRPATMPGIRRAVTEIVAAMLGQTHSLPALEDAPAPAVLSSVFAQPSGSGAAVAAKAHPIRKRIALTSQIAEPVGVAAGGDEEEEIIATYLTKEPPHR